MAVRVGQWQSEWDNGSQGGTMAVRVGLSMMKTATREGISSVGNHRYKLITFSYIHWLMPFSTLLISSAV